MDNDSVLKKAAFGGFDKQSVMNYIYELNTASKETQDKLKAQLDEATSSRNAIHETLRDMEAKVQTLQNERDAFYNELDGEKRRSSEMAAMVDSLHAQIAKQERLVMEKEEEIAEHMRINSELLQNSEGLIGKKDEVERASVYVGELMVQTKMESERMLEDAARKAQELILDAGKSIEGVHLQFDSFKKDLERVQLQVQDAMNIMQSKFAHIGSAVKNAEDSLRSMTQPQSVLKRMEQEPEPENDDDSLFRPAAEK